MSNLDILQGKTILIGREPVNARLWVSVEVNGKSKVAAIGAMNSVPNSVSRCLPAENTAHCKIGISAVGNITVTNLKPDNFTYVNDMEIISKTVKPDGMLGLGKDRFPVSVNTVVEVAAKLIGADVAGSGRNGGDKKMEKTYSICHLEKVWNEYDTARTGEQLAETKRNSIQRLVGIFSSCGIFFMAIENMGALRFVLTGISVLISIIFFVRGLNPSNSLLLRLKELDADFRKKYVCPNEDCQHFVGNIPYDVLRTNKKCPYCGCHYEA